MNTIRRSTTLNSKNFGFTLVELLITVAIVTILAAIAIPSYQQHVIKSNRANAAAFMSQIASQEEKFALDARSYTDTIGSGGLNLSIPDALSTKYTITVAVNNAATPPTFTVTAVPTSAQNDTLCGTLTLTQAGAKTPTNTACW